MLAPLNARADYVIYVANKGTPAFQHALKLTDNQLSFTQDRLHKAFILAAQILNKCGRCGVQVKIASGKYSGKAETSYWPIAQINSPKSRFRIIGGFNDNFSFRAPFSQPTILEVNNKRPGPLLHFTGKSLNLRELTISGINFNLAGSNSYDENNFALIRLNSVTQPAIDFGQFAVDRLIISDNTFMNSPVGLATWNIRPVSPNSEIIINNNLFFNNVYPWQITAQPGRKDVFSRYHVSNNSFVLNWPAGTDSLTNNPAALEIGSRKTAKIVNITGNLFAYNLGGAIHPIYDDTSGPKVSLNNNLFYQNGSLFLEKLENDSGILTGKFNFSPRNKALNMEKIDDFYWHIAENISFDPEIKIPRELAYNIKLKFPNLKPEEGKSFFVEEIFNVESFAIDGKMPAYAIRMPYDVDYLPIPQNPEAEKYGFSEKKVLQF